MALRLFRAPRVRSAVAASMGAAAVGAMVFGAMVFGAPVASSSASTVSATDGVSVMTYNIRSGSDESGHFDLRRSAQAIVAAGADVVGLQEVDRHWASRSEFRDEPAELARLTGMYVFFAPIYSLDPPRAGAPRREFGVAILSRTPLWWQRNHEITRLSTQDGDPQPTLTPGFAAASTLVHGVPLRIYCTHLDFRPDPSVRAAQVQDMTRILDRSPRTPQILLGDMNTAPQSPELAPLHDRLADAWHGPGGETYPAHAPTVRLDQILTSASLHASDTRVEPSRASDHRAVTTVLRG